MNRPVFLVILMFILPLIILLGLNLWPHYSDIGNIICIPTEKAQARILQLGFPRSFYERIENCDLIYEGGAFGQIPPPPTYSVKVPALILDIAIILGAEGALFMLRKMSKK